jgi:uncharacterized membrane protein
MYKNNPRENAIFGFGMTAGLAVGLIGLALISNNTDPSVTFTGLVAGAVCAVGAFIWKGRADKYSRK